MTLPAVAGWLIDFRTARGIFYSGSNTKINHLVDLCKSHSVSICHTEEVMFKGELALRQTFLDDQNCICFPDEDIMKKCVSVSKSPLCKKLLAGSDATIIITAIAACRDLGVISDHRSPVFNTVYDFCQHFGIHCLTADEYFALL